jgi:hypothetical protein
VSEQRIILRIRPDGTVMAETRGIKGARCLDYVAVMEEMAAAQAVDSHFTPEYHELAGEREMIGSDHHVRLEDPPS